MEIKVRDLGQVEEKSVQQVEEELLKKHEESLNDDSPKEEVSNEEAPVVESEVKEEVQEEPQEIELTEEQVLSHIRNRYNKEITSIDDLFAERETQDELPEDVAAYFKYKKG